MVLYLGGQANRKPPCWRNEPVDCAGKAQTNTWNTHEKRGKGVFFLCSGFC